MKDGCDTVNDVFIISFLCPRGWGGGGGVCGDVRGVYPGED